MKDLGFTSGGLYVVKTMVFFDEFNSSLGISMTNDDDDPYFVLLLFY